MAHRGVGGVGNRPPLIAFDRPSVGKRRIIYFEEDIGPEEVDDEEEEYPLNRPIKRRRESFTLDFHFYAERASLTMKHEPQEEKLPEFFVLKEGTAPTRLLPNPVARKVGLEPPAFFVLNEGTTPARLSPNPVAGVGLERTVSGLSISDHPTSSDGYALTELLEDAAAAQRVREHTATFRRRFPDSQHERVLRNIISPKSAAAAYPLDNDALESIFFAANAIFFNGRLSQRVTWDWSHSSSAQYDSSVIGTTALRRASNRDKRGFETLIVLSSPILQDRKYSRRLLISTFLHELIHSYLFICCGFRARHCGGHTPGFHTIAGLIDDWAGPDSFLYLSKMEADLSCFRARSAPERDPSPPSFFDQGSSQKENVYPCSGVMDDHHGYHDYHDHGQGQYGLPVNPQQPLPSVERDYDDYNIHHHHREWQGHHRVARPALPHPNHHVYHGPNHRDGGYADEDEGTGQYGSPYV